MPGKLEVWLSLERDWTISWFVLYNYQQNNKKSEKWSSELIIQELIPITYWRMKGIIIVLKTTGSLWIY